MLKTLSLSALFALTTLLTLGCAEGPQGSSDYNNALFAFRLVSKTTTLGWARDVWVDGNTAFVADDEQGITIWDVSNLSAPQLIDTIPTRSEARGVVFGHQTNLVLVNERGNIEMYDRTSKKNVGRVGTSGCIDIEFYEFGADSIFVVDFESDSDGILFQFLWKDPNDPFHIPDFPWFDRSGNIPPPQSRFRAGTFKDKIFYVSNSQFGLYIAEINSLKGNFVTTKLGSIDTPGMARDVALNRNGTHVFVADHQAGIQMIDVTDKTQPRIVGSIVPDGVNEALWVKTIGDTAIFLDQYNGMFAIDGSDPTEPRLIGIYDTPNPQGIFIRESDKKVFLADLEWGLLVLEFRQ